ncbi:MAG TPA: phenylalanine--tRNA ligase subunit alpha, partial [bacterium]|nr:phenylalanine--tRNA ligase subunit alpha [bacterium]
METIAEVRDAALAAIAAADAAALAALRVEYLGRKDGRITARLRQLGALPADERAAAGAAVNAARQAVEAALAEREAVLAAAGAAANARRDALDVTLPGIGSER